MTSPPLHFPHDFFLVIFIQTRGAQTLAHPAGERLSPLGCDSDLGRSERWGGSTLLGRAPVSQSAENFASPPSRLSPARVEPTRITHLPRRRVVACVAPRTLDDGNGARTARTAHPPSLRITTRDRTCGETAHRVPPGFDLSHEAKYLLRTAVSNAGNCCPQARTHPGTPQRSPGQTHPPDAVALADCSFTRHVLEGSWMVVPRPVTSDYRNAGGVDRNTTGDPPPVHKPYSAPSKGSTTPHIPPRSSCSPSSPRAECPLSKP
jgi:hypothetical protein